MKNLCSKRNIAIAALVLAAPVSFYMGQASEAANPVSAGLIDKDFETAVRKFVSKRFYNRIDATDEQRSKLDSIFTSTIDNTRPLREDLRKGMLDLSALYASDNATDDQITQKAHELQALHQKVADQRLDSMLKARHILTHDQRAKIYERVSEVITGGMRPRKIGALLQEG